MSASRPTILDVASRAGVSKSLVSLALSGSPKVSEKSRLRIERAAQDLGYRLNAAARSLAIQKSRTLGVLVLDLHNPVFAEILDGVQTEVRQHGFSTMLVSGGEDPTLEHRQINTLQEFQIEGLILISHRLSADVLKAVAREIPTVTVTRDDIPISRMDMVCNDDISGARLAVDHLASLGHERIVCLSGGDNPVSHARARGYSEAMEDHALANYSTIVSGGLTDSAGYRAAQEALQGDPTALFVVNDIAAMGAIAAVEEAGLRVPEDISVIGYDGIRLAGLRSINLTTVAQPLAELGRLAATRMLERLDQPQRPAQHDQVASRVVVRGTTGPPPAHPRSSAS
ncbi:LacI family DNA-binding transcriptional regulator [Pontimonas sp.]|uniref:LacI family DNA-binding transcriptional regulator n=1 Tax=Pontimonas sp. TaxID=2304492 RepID=UPI0028709740|nr:LacI family DNA-binding transcriptional regulator [Pontimonas sp.]MDR9396609.1 LacI family DNA-binding transcriptional regulator [Pontimonas sp.]